ncbi:glycogen/starch/alpha-glucan phosphorylase [Syntrophus aciditrophicus]|uniref:Alpha-1,4 glucan phosphorylase n=1 Tax=Syntrophus aciditrophicus (strain SB) TaxID=56780 RepID=Q2LUQ9_SYNAS|nr:glycogen/starch/alpha-glucan phosphorylase [Syntrophus aciditrophicus]ABC77816.1 glycogen phosphorylase [Syntrophus aciditrophicus SB]
MNQKHPGRSSAMPRLREDVRTGLTSEAIKSAILENLYYVQARIPRIATQNDWYMALAYTVRDRMLDRWVRSIAALQRSSRAVCYLSAEFLPGPHLANAMMNLGIYEQTREAVKQLGLDLDVLITQEGEPGLGNGGLGRLAACFLDSLATLEVPSIGYGIRYEFGIFDQEIRDGWQREITDKWLALGNPWEIARPEIAYYVPFGGHTEPCYDEKGRYRVRWVPERVVKGMAYDTPIPGYHVENVNILRLWKSEACESFDFQAFNIGDYYGAVEEKLVSETISKVLYPNDEPTVGKQLRLAQQFFFVSCSLQDMIRIHGLGGGGLPDTFDERYAVQLNDTHPSIAVAELMRLLVDEHGIEWERAWEITKKTFAYTNHTLLPEALEKWSLPLFRKMLPRHLEIIFEINRRFLEDVRLAYPGDDERLRRLSLIDETDDRYVRMANLAAVGSHAVNGVAALHTELLKKTVMKDIFELFPEKFVNVTNGVTPRRWMVLSNPGISRLITQAVGDAWICNTQDEIRRLEGFADDPSFRDAWYRVKQENKQKLACLIRERTGVVVNPQSLFDIQVKRIHEYKRQHLNALHIISQYIRLKRNPSLNVPPRTVIFGGKAAPGYFLAKLIIKFINSIAEVVNGDPEMADRLKVVFFPDFNVQNGQWIYPAADISEQISTAGKEASGTGNMKFSLNGALTIGTLDGANVEILEEVGSENFFLFGLTAEEIANLNMLGYNPRAFYEKNEELKEIIELIRSGFFSKGDGSLFQPLTDALLNRDEYFLLADYQSYIDCQGEAGTAYLDRDRWIRMSILNVSRMGRFSSDRSIREYLEKIWRVEPLMVNREK